MRGRVLGNVTARGIRMSSRIEVVGEKSPGADRAVTRDALALVERLTRRFGPERGRLLALRHERQREFDGGALPDFVPSTRAVREAAWTVAPAPADLNNRRVEITGPAEPKMMINALNSGAQVFMADCEDALSPPWANVVAAQTSCMDAVRRTLTYTSPEGKQYQLRKQLATLVLRPRGWHLDEAHVRLDGRPVPASLFDFGLYFYHNTHELLRRGSGPYFYLPKLESHLEARLWNAVFEDAQEALGVPQGTIRATVLIETILAAFEMDEILYELRPHAAGLNAGRWDYIFSVIKKFGRRPEFVLPDRAQVTMQVPFMRSYVELLVRTCHRRGAHAIGGMAAFIPSRRDETVNRVALAKVREDKNLEAELGFDGAWVAHPDLVPVVGEVFAERLGGRPNQKDRIPGAPVDAGRLLDVRVPGGRVTDAGVRGNVSVALQYLEAWLRGAGAVAINNLMEDTATAEIARAQLWQWIRHATVTESGPVTLAGVRALLRQELERVGTGGRWADAGALLDALVSAADFPEFLTLAAYRQLEL
jgi:malate synthase